LKQRLSEEDKQGIITMIHVK